MNRIRQAIGYVVEVSGTEVTLNLSEEHKGQIAGHYYGMSTIGEIGDLIGIDCGFRLYVIKVLELEFSEPKDLHNEKDQSFKNPLRQIRGLVIGWLENNVFIANSLSSPSLGSKAYPITNKELNIILGTQNKDAHLLLGREYRSGQKIQTDLNKLLTQHVAVLGSSGQGKSCFTASVLQQLAKLPRSKIVIFDINGEYSQALSQSGDLIKETIIGKQTPSSPPNIEHYKIPYFALGRTGLNRLFMPSEKTQRPALSFAISQLPFVEWDDEKQGVKVGGSTELFDDCRSGPADKAWGKVQELRKHKIQALPHWPSMKVLPALIAESQCITPSYKGGSYERNSFSYGNIAPLITRIHRLIEDDCFTSIIDIHGGQKIQNSNPFDVAQNELVNKIFGEANQTAWHTHIVNLTQVPQDLMPLVLGSLLECYAHVLFTRGVENKEPTLLILEEAHHYLRKVNEQEESSYSLAYERLAKEGRKFGLSLWLSTQRPSEISPTVLAQCNTWVCFRLTSEKDLSVVSYGCEWANKREVYKIAGLPRQHAIILGKAVPFPVYVKVPTANPLPNSHDGDFNSWADK